MSAACWIPAFSSRRIEQLQDSITRIVDGMLDRTRGKRPRRVRRHGRTTGRISLSMPLLDAMVNMDERRKAIFVAFHDVIPRHHLVTSSRGELQVVVAGNLRRAFDHTMEEVRVIIEERRPEPALRTSLAISSTPAIKATSSVTANCSTRFSASAAPRCRQRAVRPVVPSTCSTRTRSSWSS